MNQDQFLGMLRVLVPLVLPILTSKGIVPASAANDVVQGILGLGAAGWSIWAHTTSSKLASVEAMPQVSKVIVTLGNAAVTDVANDPGRPKVVPQSTSASSVNAKTGG